jgi:hypothetical protein
MSLPKSYKEVAEQLGLKTFVWDMAAWRDKRVTRSGIRLFLMRSYYVPTFADPPWLRLWKQIEWTREQCRTLRVVIPPELWQEDKARLAAKIAATRDARYPEEKERALRWTRR